MTVITGAASGIGKATTQLLLESGRHVIAADRDAEGLDRLAGELGGTADGRLSTTVVDVRHWSEVQAWAAGVTGEWGTPDELVANAGINPEVAASGAVDEALWDDILDVNLKGVFACCRGFLPAMAKAGRGAVVTVASVAGLVAWGGSSVYGASKAGVIGLSRFLAVEYAPSGVRINCVCPGAVRTPMAVNRWNSSPDPEQRYAATVAMHPLGRVAEALDVARVIEFALSERAGFVTGSVLTVDGGRAAL